MRGQQIIIHQAVHGYVEGHRELWSSLLLKPRDVKTVLVYSDTSGSGLRIGDHGYLTGYPLPESGLYAIARTWPAPEVQRPGAVWTHTLFVEFADVASLRDASALLALFRRPLVGATPKGNQAQREPIELGVTEASPFLFRSLESEVWYRQVVSCLYGNPDSKVLAIVPFDETQNIDSCVLALWSQQWPRLRRAFRFCTLTATDRSTEKTSFDLQLVPESERGMRSRFPAATLAQEALKASEPWVDHLAQDLNQPSMTGLRDFLQQAGADISAGRGALISLTRLHMILNSSVSSQSSWAEAIRLVGGLSEGAVSTVSQIVLSAAAKDARLLDQKSLEFLLKNLDAVNRNVLEQSAAELGLAVWANSPARIEALYDESQMGRLIADAALDALPQEDLVAGLPYTHRLADVALSRRLDLLSSSAIWQSSSALVEKALQAAAREPSVATAALEQMIVAGPSSLATHAFTSFGPERVWQHLAGALGGSPELRRHLLPWLNAGARYPGSLAQLLASRGVSDRRTLVAIAQATDPDLVPNDYGDDPWAIALETAIGSTSTGEETYFSCYLLARALGPRSRNIDALVESSLSIVYDAAAGDLLSSSAWEVVEPRLPRASYWQQWDRCQQLLAGIAQLYVRRDLSTLSFCRLGRSEQEFTGLVEAVAKEWGGRSYLRGVKRELRSQRPGNFDRVRIVDEAVGSRL